jgi:hypothetical protein
MFTRLLARLALIALALTPAACSISSDPDPQPLLVTPSPSPSPSTGTYTLLWTIGNRIDPNACYALGADAMELVLYSGGGATAPILAPCEAFEMSVELAPGTYNADATLVRGGGTAVTATLQLDNLVIVSGTTLTSDTDF